MWNGFSVLLGNFEQKNKMSRRNSHLRSILWAPVAAGMWVEALSCWSEVCSQCALQERRGVVWGWLLHDHEGSCSVPPSWALWSRDRGFCQDLNSSALVLDFQLIPWSWETLICLSREVLHWVFSVQSTELVSRWFVAFQVAGAWRKMRQECRGSWDCKVQWQV